MKISEIKVSYHPVIPPVDRHKVTSSSAAFEYLKSIWNDQLNWKETFYILYLDRKNSIIGYHLHSIGSDTGTLVSSKQVLSVALKCNACGIILAHNHPSGNLKPSQADLNISRKIKKGGEVLDVEILDHIIICQGDSYYSMSDAGEL